MGNSERKDLFEFAAGAQSILGPKWHHMYSCVGDVPFSRKHFEQAMGNLIREPNINSSALLRADILREYSYDISENISKCLESHSQDVEISDKEAKTYGTSDFEVREPDLSEDLDLKILKSFVRRLVPRNPYKDSLINQTCLIMNSPKSFPESSLVIYTPHIDFEENCPFYIPCVASVGIFLHQGSLSVHYMLFESSSKLLTDESERVVRTAWRLLQTAFKHSKGVLQGYEKRVNHDQVVDRVKFQDKYIILKKKHSKFLMDNWAESTNPKKHVFEDIAIAAFLLELWEKMYGPEFKNQMQFRDLGCGNGVLCYILIEEGCKGVGVDARQRKSWAIYPPSTKNCLKEQVIVPSILLRPHPDIKKQYPDLKDNCGGFAVNVNSSDLIAPATIWYTSDSLLNSPQVNVTEYPDNTFIIGNHSDELTCWIPLLGYPFLVIPCCSHNLSGQRVRFYPKREKTAEPQNSTTASTCNSAKTPKNNENKKTANSTYAGLVSNVKFIAKEVGWEVQEEMLRIPSTRNAAVIGLKNDVPPNKFLRQKVYDIIQIYGGANDWIGNVMALMKKSPRNH